MSILTPIPHRNSPAQNNSGFTLIELMISLAITAILLAMAVPAMFDFLERNQSRAIISEVRNLVALARENAVHHGCNTVMCPSEDQIQCTRNMGAPAIVFSDCNENRQIDGNDQLYRVTFPP